MYKIFVYGTLKSKYLQNKLLGHTLESYDAKLVGYSINTAEEFYNVVPDEGGCVNGKVLLVSKEDFAYIDQWEVIPMYLKAEVSVESEYGTENVYIYIKKEKDKKIKLQDNTEGMSNIENLEARVDDFARHRDTEFPVCDIYLNYPVEADSDALRKYANNQDFFTEEFKNLIKDKVGVKRDCGFIGYEYLGYGDISIRVSLYYSINKDKSYTLTVMLPVCTCNPLDLWKDALENKLVIGDCEFSEYLYKKYGIKILQSPKLFMFSSGEISEDKRFEIFKTGEIKDSQNSGIDSTKTVNTDISKNTDKKLYSSKNAVIEIPKEFKFCYEERVKSHIITMFTM